LKINNSFNRISAKVIVYTLKNGLPIIGMDKIIEHNYFMQIEAKSETNREIIKEEKDCLFALFFERFFV
jgi:hypothetical protein